MFQLVSSACRFSKFLNQPLVSASTHFISARYKSSSTIIKIFEKIRENFRQDAFGGLLIDLTAVKLNKNILSSNTFKKFLKNEMEVQKTNCIHVMGLKIPANEGAVMKVAISCGFRHHHANAEYSLLNYCLSQHTIKECSFPAFRTISAGVTIVVFTKDLKEVLVVMEQVGPIKKFKPPTGGIDYGLNEDTPLKAAIRELEEETQIVVDPASAILVGTGWSNNYRGTNPDISYIFAFVLNEKQQPVAQTSEISKAQWISVEEFMQEPTEEKNKPWLLRQAVIAGHQALRVSKDTWKVQTLYLTTGKPVDFFSSAPKE